MQYVPIDTLRTLRRGVPPDLLVDSVKEVGILTPLTISRNNIVTNGVLRFYAAKKVGLTHVPVEGLRR